MLIDIHAHTTIHKLWDLHTSSATIKDLERLAKEYDIRRIVLMATYFPFKGTGLHNLELLRRIAGKDLFLMFGSLDIMNNFERGLAELELMARKKLLSGIKLYPGYQDFHASDPDIFPIYRLAEKYSLPVMLHTGELHSCCEAHSTGHGEKRCHVCHLDKLAHESNPSAITEAVRTFPDVTFVLSHLANPYYDELISLMRECPNVMTDISGLFRSGSGEDTEDYLKQLTDTLHTILTLPNGADRVLYGSDFPIQSHADTLKLVDRLYIDDETKQKILHRNATKLLKL